MLCLKQENLNGQYGSLNEKKKNDKKEGQDKEGSNASKLPSGEFDKLLFRLICAMILFEVV